MRQNRRRDNSVFRWFHWHAVTTKLQARLRAIVRGQAYKVFLLHGEQASSAPAFCDFDKKKIGVDPVAFSDAFEKKRGIPAADIDEANYQASRALLEHEAAHVKYSSAEVWHKVGQYLLWAHVTNLLEDARIENIISQNSNVSKTLMDFLTGIAREGHKEPETVTEENPEYILYLILRWRLRMPDMKLTDPVAVERWEHVLPLCEEARWAPTMYRVREIADEILEYLGTGRGKSMTELQQEFEKELRKALARMESEKTGRTNKPEKNPLKAPDGIKQKEAGGVPDGGKKGTDRGKDGKQPDSDGKGEGEKNGTDNDLGDNGKGDGGDESDDGSEGNGTPENSDSGQANPDGSPDGDCDEAPGDGGQDSQDGGGSPEGDPAGDTGSDSGAGEDASGEGSEGSAAGDSQDMGEDQDGSDSRGTGSPEEDDTDNAPDSQGGTDGREDDSSGRRGNGSGDSGGADSDGESVPGEPQAATQGSVSRGGTSQGDSVRGDAESEQAQDVPGGESGVDSGGDGAAQAGDTQGDAAGDEPQEPRHSNSSRQAGRGLARFIHECGSMPKNGHVSALSGTYADLEAVALVRESASSRFVHSPHVPASIIAGHKP